MFTGIIETLGIIKDIQKEGTNIHFQVNSPISKELKVDQSVSHDGVCLTVTQKDDKSHWVTAIDETIQKTNLSQWQIGKSVNLERAMVSGGRLDGHIVQGHVDMTAICTQIKNVDGSFYFSFNYPMSPLYLLVDKGSICINGVSLTVVAPQGDDFSVAIIPYTLEHTTFHNLKVGDKVNLEFDILGKYISKYLQAYGDYFSKQ